MTRVPCASCGAEHDLSDLEPGYPHPDAFLEVPPEERDWRTIGGKDDRSVREDEDSTPQYFFRAVLPVPVRGEPEPKCWGVWVEVSRATWDRVRELWNAEDQHLEPPFAGQLANDLRCYPSTRGLPGTLHLAGADAVPRFVLREEVDHPLAVDQREGVYLEQVLEWLSPALHA